jgi:hypothetical protein
VEAAREAANDNVAYLQQLRRYLDKLNMLDEFIALVPLFKPVMHTMLLIWKHSKYYNTSARFVTLLQEICNDLIMQVGISPCRAQGRVCAYDTSLGITCCGCPAREWGHAAASHVGKQTWLFACPEWPLPACCCRRTSSCPVQSCCRWTLQRPATSCA